jgi:hypothetical protein
MTNEQLEAEIAILAAKADALRPLDDDAPAKQALTGYVDSINELRERQSELKRRGIEDDGTPQPKKRGRSASA